MVTATASTSDRRAPPRAQACSTAGCSRSTWARATVRWRYSWGDGSIRGVDIFRVQDGKVAEKLSYVKG